MSSRITQLPAAAVIGAEQVPPTTFTVCVVVPLVAVNVNVAPAAPLSPALQISIVPFAATPRGRDTGPQAVQQHRADNRNRKRRNARPREPPASISVPLPLRKLEQSPTARDASCNWMTVPPPSHRRKSLRAPLSRGPPCVVLWLMRTPSAPVELLRLSCR